MNRRQKIIVSVTGIFIVLLALVGLTYAYFLTQIEGNKNDTSISVTTANLKIEYIEGDSDGDGVADALITADKIKPDTIIAEKVFSVKNSGNKEATYSIILDNMTNEFDRNQDLVYTLTKSGVTDPVQEGYLAVGTHQIILPSVTIGVNVTDTYTLKLEYVEAGVDQSIDMDKTLNLRVNISNETYTWDTAPSGSLLYALKTNQPSGTEETTPAQTPSSANEARVLTTEDDYGTSYVYRGAVTNNYVNYSGMCWKVVRIQGDGTIKLILENEDYECGPDVEANEGKSYDDNDLYSGYNNSFVKNGLMKDYSSSNSFNSSYSPYSLDYYVYENNSEPFVYVDDWATKKQLDRSQLIATDWCNDTSISDLSNVDNEEYFFGAYKRLLDEKTPTLKCNMKGLNNSKAIRYSDSIAILSADEYIFAGVGGVNWDGTTNNNYIHTPIYAINASSGDYHLGYEFWTMSPLLLTVNYQYYCYGWVSGSAGLPGNGSCDYGSPYVRPAIVLNSNVMLDTNVTGQNGTSTNPYVID